MFKNLRIASAIVAAAFVAAVMPVGTIVNWTAAIICAMCACLFFGLTLVFKQMQESAKQNKENANRPHGDFFNPAPPTEQNETESIPAPTQSPTGESKKDK